VKLKMTILRISKNVLRNRGGAVYVQLAWLYTALVQSAVNMTYIHMSLDKFKDIRTKTGFIL
jgi:hypothetical protein